MFFIYLCNFCNIVYPTFVSDEVAGTVSDVAGTVPGIHYLKNILLSGKQKTLILLQNQLDLFFVLLFLMVLYLFLAREILFPPIFVLSISQLPSAQVPWIGSYKIDKTKIGENKISLARNKYKTIKNNKTKNKSSWFCSSISIFCFPDNSMFF